jgi:AAA domain, putative AbiEii toxin, Type IV TA system
MQAEDKYSIGDISRDIANLVPGMLKIRVVRDRLTDRYAIQAKTSDQRTFSSHVLSDGTLRLLALATLKNDPRFHGVLCIEEPENGVDPLHLKNMVGLLRAMATDFSDPEQLEKPLRQVIVTSHSPTFISLPEVINSLIFAFKTTRVEPQKNTFQVTRMVPIPVLDQSTKMNADEKKDIAVETYTSACLSIFCGRFKKGSCRITCVVSGINLKALPLFIDNSPHDSHSIT